MPDLAVNWDHGTWISNYAVNVEVFSFLCLILQVHVLGAWLYKKDMLFPGEIKGMYNCWQYLSPEWYT